MTKEQKFYKALQDIFVGAKIEGVGGFINLMRIKSNYYSQIEKHLYTDMDNALKKYPKFREELFDKLYSFFSRYFTKSGSIYFNSTSFHNDIYEKVYTDERDVILFWKTQMLYYVKTDRIFRSMPVEFDDYKFHFDASTIENKKSNEKRSLIFELKQVKENRTILFSVKYSEKGKITKTDDILKELKKKRLNISEDQINRAFRVFEKQSEVDFFINKNAKDFLQEQFKLWNYQYYWSEAKEWSAERVNELQILKDCTFKIIDFISQFENELVKIWNKPKFVRNSNYVITLDRISDDKLMEKLFKHSGMKEQIHEWNKLEVTNKSKILYRDIFDNTIHGNKLKKEFEHLPIDTKYFKDLEFDILELFDDLDNMLDGWLIKSENYQAINTILNKFKEEIQTIFIDPPFNLESSDQFLYRTNYKDSNWATLLENRIRISKKMMNEKGSIFVRCDYNGNWIVRCLMDEIFDRTNFKNEIIVSKSNRIKTKGTRFLSWHDTVFYYSLNKDKLYFEHIFNKREEQGWRSVDNESEVWAIIPTDIIHLLSSQNVKYNKDGDPTSRARVILGKEYLPPPGRRFPTQEQIYELEKSNSIKINENGNPQMLKSEKIYLTDNWTDISGYSSNWEFDTENSEPLLQRIIECSSQRNEIVFDFFDGSGTSTAVAHKLKRKWIGVEMGEHFFTKTLPRMKKVLAYDKTAISKDLKDYKGGGFFKYFELEQYEDALNNCKFDDSNLFTSSNKSPYEEYVFMKDDKMLKVMDIDFKKEKIKIDLTKLYPDIDLPETLSNITGKWIKKIRKDEVEFIDGTKINTKNIDYKLIKPLIWW